MIVSSTSAAAIRRVMVALAASALIALLAACGSGSSSTGTQASAGAGTQDSGGATEADLARYDKELEKLYIGTYKEPTGPAIKPPPNKNIWVVVSGMDSEGSQNAAAGIKGAASELGWKVTVVDGKFDSTVQQKGIEQALADKADGIVVGYIDCAPIKTALERAKQQGVPTVGIEGKDCDPPVFAHSVLYVDDMGFDDFGLAWGGAQATWVVAKTKGQAKTIINTQTDLQTIVVDFEGVRKVFDECPTCEIVGDAQFVGADFGPPLQDKIAQQFVKHPEANSFIAAYDAALTSGGANAIKATGRLDQIKVMGGEGSSAVVKLIHQGVVGACVGLPTEYEGWASVDSVARLILGRDANESNSGIGVQVCDKDHNLPPAGQAYKAPIDFKAAYRKLWGLG